MIFKHSCVFILTDPSQLRKINAVFENKNKDIGFSINIHTVLNLVNGDLEKVLFFVVINKNFGEKFKLEKETVNITGKTKNSKNQTSRHFLSFVKHPVKHAFSLLHYQQEMFL